MSERTGKLSPSIVGLKSGINPLPFGCVLAVDDQRRIVVPKPVRIGIQWLHAVEGTRDLFLELDAEGTSLVKPWTSNEDAFERNIADTPDGDADLSLLRLSYFRVQIDNQGRIKLPYPASLWLGDLKREARHVAAAFFREHFALWSMTRWKKEKKRAAMARTADGSL